MPQPKLTPAGIPVSPKWGSLSGCAGLSSPALVSPQADIPIPLKCDSLSSPACVTPHRRLAP